MGTRNPRLTMFILMLATIALGLLAMPIGANDTERSSDRQSDARAQRTFERLKALEGTWYGKMHDGSPVELEYRLTGQGTSIVETFRKIESTDHDMLTVYHLDGDRVMLTHYCIVGNQPRMVATPGSDPNTIRFDFHDVTGTTDEGFMHHALIKLDGEDLMHQDWTYRQQGKDVFTEAVEYRRVK